MKPLFLLSAILVCLAWVYPQKEKNQFFTEIHFSQVWVWEYLNPYFQENTQEYLGEIVVYFNPEKNYWLFTSEAYGVSDEMTTWTLGMPGGKYINNYVDVHGKQKQYIDSVTISPKKSIPQYYSPLQNFKKYISKEIGFLNFDAQEFQVAYLKTNDITCIYLSESEIDFSPVYYFNLRNAEAKMPMYFPTDLPPKIKILEMNTKSSNTIQFKFKEQGHTSYTILLNLLE